MEIYKSYMCFIYTDSGLCSKTFSHKIIYVLSDVRKDSGQKTSRFLVAFVPKGREWDTLPRVSDNRESDLVVAALSGSLSCEHNVFKSRK